MSAPVTITVWVCKCGRYATARTNLACVNKDADPEEHQVEPVQYSRGAS